MEDYIESLRRGHFRVPVCKSCGAVAWPPSTRCASCYSGTALQDVDLSGTVVEFSTSHVKSMEGTFGVVDMNGIRIVGLLMTGTPHAGMKVRMTRCGVREDGIPYYDFEPTLA